MREQSSYVDLNIICEFSRYILVTNKICQKSCCNMKDYKELDWVKNIEWQAVFDFNPDTFHDGLGSVVLDAKDVLMKPMETDGMEMDFIASFASICPSSVASIAEKLEMDPTGKELKFSLRIGERSLWISCAGN